MIETMLFEEPNTRFRFLDAPCLKEREQYLNHLMLRGYGRPYLRVASYVMLRIVQFLPLAALRTVELEEIERAAQAWASYRGPDRRGIKSCNTTVLFSRVAKSWLRFHDRLAEPAAPVHPYETEIADFTDFLRSTSAVSSATIDAYRWRVKLVLSSLDANERALSSVTLNDIDKFFEAKTRPGMASPDARQSLSGATGLLPPCGGAWLVLAGTREGNPKPHSAQRRRRFERSHMGRCPPPSPA